jgi:uncharacterized protein YndB with AHSA1/START domain
VERSQAISAPPGRLWTLLSGPQAWSIGPSQFAFDVTVPPDTTLRVVLGVNGTRPFVGTFQVQDEVPGQAISMRLGAPANPVQVISFSAVTDGDSSAATITVRYRGPRARADRDRWERRLAGWLSGLRSVAEGRAPDPGPGMPESLRVQCTPGEPLRKPVTASASALIAAPPATVWDVICAPETAMTTNAESVAAGAVPGTPVQQAGEMQYCVHKEAGGWFTTHVDAVTELDPGRSALTTRITFPHFETSHVVTPQAQGTRLEVISRWPGNLPGAKSKAGRRKTADALQQLVNGYRDLIEFHGTQQP